MSPLKSKLPNVGTTIFTIMSKMANDCGAINLSQGFPDFPVSEKLIDLIHRKMKEGHNQYAPMAGTLQLRESIAQYANQRYAVNIDSNSEVTITAGATEALYSAINALITPGDEAIVFDPCYDSYDPAIRLAGGTPVHIPLTDTTFSIDWDMVRESINQKTKLIIINSPHNPTGTLLSENDLIILQQLVIQHKLYLLSDEVYEHIVFDDLVHSSVLSFPDLYERSVVVFSFGKTFHATGWKVGYTIAPENITIEIRKIHQYLTFSVNTPVQLALAEYLHEPENYLQLGKFYQNKRDYFVKLLKPSKFEIMPCKGTYFQLLSFQGISDLSEVKMAEKLTRENGVASIPVSVFYETEHNNSILRFCFAKSEDTLKKAANILCRI